MSAEISGPSCGHHITTLGLDVGIQRVGMALYQPELATIVPLPTVERAGKRAEQKAIRLVQQNAISQIVVGTPLSSSNEKTLQEEDVSNFNHRLARRCSALIILCDEFLSSEEAKELLGIRGSPNRAIRESGAIDAVAACLILLRHLTTKGINPTLEIGALVRQLAKLQRRT
jgi:putative transcription antitermination factor YqgF